MNKQPWLWIIFGVIIGFLFSGVLMIWLTRPDRSAPIQIKTAPPRTWQFEIYGAVMRPGVYNTDQIIRIGDAVSLAGGFTENADQELSRSALTVLDGDMILIPTKSMERPTITPFAFEGNRVRINLNLATIEELMKLPGIGAKKAQDIIHYRETNGGFHDASDLLKIDGFGEKTVEQLIDQLIFETEEKGTKDDH